MAGSSSGPSWNPGQATKNSLRRCAAAGIHKRDVPSGEEDDEKNRTVDRVFDDPPGVHASFPAIGGYALHISNSCCSNHKSRSMDAMAWPPARWLRSWHDKERGMAAAGKHVMATGSG